MASARYVGLTFHTTTSELPFVVYGTYCISALNFPLVWMESRNEAVDAKTFEQYFPVIKNTFLMLFALVRLAIFTVETNFHLRRIIHLQNPSKLKEKQTDRVRQIVHSK